MKVDRMLRVNELLRRELGQLVERDVAPRMQALVTITRVTTSPDLRQSKVYVSVLGGEEQREEALRLLHEYRRDMQKELGRRVRFKYTPVLRFESDRSIEEADHVLSIIDDLGLDEEDDE